MYKYWLYFRVSLIRTFAYRGQMLIYTLASLLSIVPMVAVWLSVGKIAVANYSSGELITYYLVGLFFQRLIYSSLINYYVQEISADGSIVGLFLTKPVSFFWATLGLSLGWTVVAIVVGFFFAILAAFFVGGNLVFQVNYLLISLTIIASLIGLMLVFTSSLVLGLISLWTVQISSFVSLYWIALLLFAGITLPLSFFPPLAHNFINLLPFRFMFSFPIEVLLGKVNSSETFLGYLLGTGWVVFFLAMYKVFWKLGNRAYTGYGQ